MSIVTQNPNYSFSFVLDRTSMFSVQSRMSDGKLRYLKIFPLSPHSGCPISLLPSFTFPHFLLMVGARACVLLVIIDFASVFLTCCSSERAQTHCRSALWVQEHVLTTLSQDSRGEASGIYLGQVSCVQCEQYGARRRSVSKLCHESQAGPEDFSVCSQGSLSDTSSDRVTHALFIARSV